MAKVRSNLILQGTSGRIGAMLMTRLLPDGRTLLCARPDFSRRIFSPQQTAHQLRFRQASDYARKAAAREPLYAALAAGTMKTAYNIALSDWFHPPVVHAIETADTLVRVNASDNVQVARVVVTLQDAAGRTLEQGPATPADGFWWHYTLSAPPLPGQRLQAEAYDLAGNKAAVITTLS